MRKWWEIFEEMHKLNELEDEVTQSNQSEGGRGAEPPGAGDDSGTTGRRSFPRISTSPGIVNKILRESALFSIFPGQQRHGCFHVAFVISRMKLTCAGTSSATR